MGSKNLDRRDFLRLAGMGAVSVLGGGLLGINPLKGLKGLQPAPTATPGMDMAAPQGTASSFAADAEVSITALEKTVQILPGTSTRVMAYEGKLVGGTGVAVVNLPNNYLGPVLRVKSGTNIRITLQNNLRETTVLHPHGLRVPQNCDGSPMQSVEAGKTKVYEFKVVDRASPAWFHPHPMGRTPEEVYLGMAGVFYIWDDEEEMAVPGASTGANDIPVIIQDRIFSSDNQLVYQPTMMYGLLGNRILVNGTLDASCGLEPRGYRLRLLNGSNARTYKLAWSNGMALTVIGTDAGLLPKAETKQYVMLMPGERVDIWADFSSLSGKSVVLKSLPFSAGMGMMGGGMMGSSAGRGMGMRGNSTSGMGMMGGYGGVANGAALDILTVNVGTTTTSNPVLGTLPMLPESYDASNVSNFNSPTTFDLSMGMMMAWTINGLQYDMTAVADNEKVMLNQPVAWEFRNFSPIAHPMHIHNVHFQVVQRTPSPLASYAEVVDGLINSGLKDTVMVWPGERVKIAMKFGPNAGMYMYHCHILEHEDMGMMRNLLIV